MSLEPLKIVKRWFTNSPNVQECWDEIADKVSAALARVNNNLKQLGVDLGGENYDFNNQGKGTETTPITTRLVALESPRDAIGTQNLALDLSSQAIVKLVQADGSELSSSAPGKVTFNSTANAGELVTRDIAAALSLTLTGCHWGFDTLGDLTDRKLWILLIDTGSSVILGVDATGGRQTVSSADAETVATSVNSIEKVFCTSEPGGTYNCIYLGWLNVDFDDTGNGGGENYWTIQTGVGDINLGRGETESINKVIDGDLEVAGESTLKIAYITSLGAENPGMVSNLGLSLSSGVLSLVDTDGALLSATNPGFVSCRSSTGGRSKAIRVTGLFAINDSAGSSDFVNEEFGISASANWAEDMPFFLYLANRNGTDADATDGNSHFFLTRNPAMKVTPASANDIGDTGAIPSNDSQDVIIFLGDVTIADYVSLPCQLVGAIRMRYATATHDWTIQTLGATDGIGPSAIDRTISTWWNFPTGQLGAASGTFIKDNAGTAPTFSGNIYRYAIDRQGFCRITVACDQPGATPGAGAVEALVTAPLKATTTSEVFRQWGSGYVYSSIGVTCVVNIKSAEDFFRMYYTTWNQVLNSSFAHGTNREFGASLSYKAF